jgi:hypothetical protein
MTDALIPLGLHFGLPFERYLDDPGLGSGNIRKLAMNPSDYWFESAMNPERQKRKDKKAFVLGHALHKFVIEGREAFDDVFLRGPTVDDALTSGQKGVATKRANAEAAQSGLVMLKADEYDGIARWAGAIHRNPYLTEAFKGGFGEVSVFWEREGVRLKGRFDYLKIMKRPGYMLAANGDLKTVENIYGDTFKRVCRQAIERYHYDAQAAHYIDGLARIPQMVREKRTYTNALMLSSFPDDWLKQFLASEIRYAWQWIFVQKNGFPTTCSFSMTPGLNENPGSAIFETGASKVNRGLQNYINCMAKFGPDKPWEEFEPPEELMSEDMPYAYGKR